MVCIPCIFIPIFLFVYHRFLHPIFLRFLPWGRKEAVTSAPEQRPISLCPETEPKKNPTKSRIAKSTARMPQKVGLSTEGKSEPSKSEKKVGKAGEPSHTPRSQTTEDRTGSAMGASGELAENKKVK